MMFAACFAIAVLAAGPLLPAPSRSVGAKVVSSPKGGAVATDGVIGNGSWEAKLPTAAQPSWLAIDVGQGPRRLLLWWQSGGNPNYDETTYGGPGSYRIETSADSGDGEGGTWKVVVTVTDNVVMNRAHAFDFTGQRWVRLAVTGPSRQTYKYGVQLGTVAVHDVSGGADDTWLFAGDSITAEVYRGGPKNDWRPTFAEHLSKANPRYAPVALAAGVGFSKSEDLLKSLPKWLEWNADLKHWAIGIGSNNPADNAQQIGAFKEELNQIVTRLLAAGKVPVLARIPFQLGRDVQPLNAVLDEVVAKHGLTRGPDLYAHFKAHPEQLRDGLHPTDEGGRQLHRLWAEAVRGLYAGAAAPGARK